MNARIEAGIPAAATRPAATVMSPSRIASVVAGPLSFPRTALRELVRERWQVRKLRFDLDAEGRGEVLYLLEGAGWRFHFFLVSQKLDEAQKTDRNFAASWDAMGVLCQGEWSEAREAWLRQEVPKQRAGFADYDTLMYARGNRSARVFEHVVDSLARGEQPDMRLIAPVGYILRTTAFIGNGQLGTRAFAGFEPGHPLRRPYHAQFVSGFMLREYVFDLVDHMARMRNPRAARLAPAWRRYLGLGNSAATGLAAFAANHPHLMHQWTLAHESASALARETPAAPDAPQAGRVAALLDKAILHFEEGARADDGVFLPPQALAGELARAREVLRGFARSGAIEGAPTATPWAALDDWACARLHREAQEVLRAIVLEAHPAIVARFTEAFLVAERFAVQPEMAASALAALVERHYGWTREAAQAPGASHYFWYRCASAPRDVRRGPRGGAPELEHETTLETLLQVRRLREALATTHPQAPVAELVCARPELRGIVARVQSLAGLDYAELQQDYQAADYAPFATIRYPLAFFGMEKLEAAPPKSVRGVFLQGAPIAEDVAAGREGGWPFPLMPTPAARDMALAPLPPAGLGARPPARASAPLPLPEQLRLAPSEVARMVQVALQGHGASFGVAQEAGELALFAQGRGLPAVAAVLAHCERGPQPPSAGRDLREPVPRDAAFTALRGQDRLALLAAPAAGDLVLAAQPRPGGATACLVRDARDACLAQGLVLRCASQGRLALLCWHGEAAGSAGVDAGVGAGADGFALAWPEAEGVALVTGALAAPAAAHVALHRSGAVPPLAPAAAIASLLAPAAAGQAGDLPPGFALFAAAVPPAWQASDALQALRAAGPGVHHEGAEAREAGERARRERGVAIEAAQFHALARAGQALLVPQQGEQRFLPPGFDPLKAF